MERIGLFCAAQEEIDDIYFRKAREWGEWIGKEGKTLLFGGADIGLMAVAARAAQASGGFLIGVVPTRLQEMRRVFPTLDQTILTNNLSDRKDILLRESDILVALPGGIGTLDEIFHVMAARSIGYHTKTVVFYNINGYWNRLITVLHEMEKSGFVKKNNDLYIVVDTLDQLKQLLK